ncbi:hypothetical protein D3C86_1589820 [compost metagenome]
MVGPSSTSRPSLPEGLKPGKGQLELTHRYANGEGLKGADYKVTDSAGQVKTGTLDAKGFAAVSGLAPGGARIELGKDPADPWDESSYIGKPSWPAREGSAVDMGVAPPNDMLDGLMAQAADAAKGKDALAATLKAGLAGGATSAIAKALGGPMGGAITGLASTALGGNALRAANVAKSIRDQASGAATTALSGIAQGVPGLGAPAAPSRLPPGILPMHTTV